MKKLLFITTFSFSLLSFADPIKDASVEFHAIGKPAFIKINGESKQLTYATVTEKGKIFDVFEFPLDTLNSGIDLRDEHMKEKYLEVKKYPKAILKIPATSKTENALNFTGEKTLIGELTLHGQTKPVTITATNKSSHYDGEFEIKLSDYGIEIPSWSGITVADTVKVKTSFTNAATPAVLAR